MNQTLLTARCKVAKTLNKKSKEVKQRRWWWSLSEVVFDRFCRKKLILLFQKLPKTKKKLKSFAFKLLQINQKLISCGRRRSGQNFESLLFFCKARGIFRLGHNFRAARGGGAWNRFRGVTSKLASWSAMKWDCDIIELNKKSDSSETVSYSLSSLALGKAVTLDCNCSTLVLGISTKYTVPNFSRTPIIVAVSWFVLVNTIWRGIVTLFWCLKIGSSHFYIFVGSGVRVPPSRKVTTSVIFFLV